MSSSQKSKTICQVRKARESVFLSCSSRNAPFVAEVSKYLKLHFDSVESSLFPNKKLPPQYALPQQTHGDSVEHIEQQISNCSVFVSFFGEVFDDQQACEIALAVHSDHVSGNKRRFIVYLLDGTPPPSCMENDDFLLLRNSPCLSSKSLLTEAERVAAEIKKYIRPSISSGENNQTPEVDYGMSTSTDQSTSDKAMRAITADRAMCSSSIDIAMNSKPLSVNPQDEIKSTIRQADGLVKQGDFERARDIVRRLNHRLSGPGLSDVIQDLLMQIDEAERKHNTKAVAEAAIDEAQRFINQGDFGRAKVVIDGLPNVLSDLKSDILCQIDVAAEQWRHTSLENERLLAGLNCLDTAQVIGELAARNNLDVNNPWVLNALLRAIIKHAEQPVPYLAGETASPTESPSVQGFSAAREVPISKPMPQTATSSGIAQLDDFTEFFPHGSVDNVIFSITSPPVMLPKSSYMIDIWAHVAEQQEKVLALARVAAGSDSVTIRSEGPFEVTKGTVLTVRLNIQNLAVEPSEKIINWKGEIGRAGFCISVPKGAAQGTRRGVATILICDIPLVKIFFVINIGDRASNAVNLPVQEKRYRTAFISYSSKDQADVVARVQGLRKGIPGLDVFWPPSDIEPGANWRDALAKEIVSRDVMYLFWSVAASKSRWVDWEWRYAFKNRGIGFIDPCPLVPPEVAPPPRELADHLHFNDWALAYMAHSDANVTRPSIISRASQAIMEVMSAVFSRRNWQR